MEDLSPGHVGCPDLEENKGGVDSGPYDNDVINILALKISGPNYQDVHAYTSMRQGTICAPKNSTLTHWS